MALNTKLNEMPWQAAVSATMMFCLCFNISWHGSSNAKNAMNRYVWKRERFGLSEQKNAKAMQYMDFLLFFLA